MKTTVNKKKLKFYPKKLLRNIFWLIVAIWWIWMTISYGEIIMKNLNPNPQYSDWNIIVNFIEYIGRY